MFLLVISCMKENRDGRRTVRLQVRMWQRKFIFQVGKVPTYIEETDNFVSDGESNNILVDLGKYNQ